MCGINGIFQLSSGGTHLKDAVSAMNAQLAHRGPDDNGVWIDDIKV
jgi:asparagine synthase (glutamine-hydrolysing)